MSRPGYVKVANDIGASEEALALPEDVYLAAIGLFTLCLGYCDRQLTDGAIPERALSRAIAPGIECAGLIAELENVGLIEATDDGWVIPGYLKWQRSREDIEAAATKASKAAAARWGKAGRNAKPNAKRNASSNASSNAKERIGKDRTREDLNPLALTDQHTDQFADEFETWWGSSGRMGTKGDARLLYRYWRDHGATADELLRAVENYVAHCVASDRTLMDGRTFLAKTDKHRHAVNRWREWADGEEHGSGNVRESTRLRSVLEAGTEIYDLGGNGDRAIGSPADPEDGAAPRRRLPAGRMAAAE